MYRLSKSHIGVRLITDRLPHETWHTTEWRFESAGVRVRWTGSIPDLGEWGVVPSRCGSAGKPPLSCGEVQDDSADESGTSKTLSRVER